VAEEPGDDLDGHARADQLGGMGVAEHVDGEVDAGPSSYAPDELVNRCVGHRRAPPTRPQVHEDVVGVDVAVFAVHVIRVQADEPGGDRQLQRRAQLGPSAVGVVGPRDDVHLLATADEVGLSQPEGLADAHPRLGQQRQQEPVAGSLGRGEYEHHLLGAERARLAARNSQLDRSHGDRSALADVVQEGLVGPLPARRQATRLAATATPERAWCS
jgi:hypothetical protein